MNHEDHHRGPHLNVRAGLLAAAGWGAAGAVAAAAVVAGLDWHGSYMDTALAPMLGCGSVLASAAWTAYAPRPARSFGVSLVAVVAGTLLCWIVLASLEVTPRRYKGLEHPAMYLSEAMLIVIPPIFMAAAMVVIGRRPMLRP